MESEKNSESQARVQPVANALLTLLSLPTLPVHPVPCLIHAPFMQADTGFRLASALIVMPSDQGKNPQGEKYFHLPVLNGNSHQFSGIGPKKLTSGFLATCLNSKMVSRNIDSSKSGMRAPGTLPGTASGCGSNAWMVQILARYRPVRLIKSMTGLVHPETSAFSTHGRTRPFHQTRPRLVCSVLVQSGRTRPMPGKDAVCLLLLVSILVNSLGNYQ